MASELKQEKYYTFEEYLKIDDGNKYELNDGILYLMSSPSDPHGAISIRLIIQIGNFLEGKTCEIRHDENVRLWKDQDTVYIPDIWVVCDTSKIENFGCNGAPDFIIEIISLSNAYRDYLVKLSDYRRAGVKEYWIVEPKDKKVLVNILDENEYQLSVYTFDDPIEITVLPGCRIDLYKFK